jgi:undecaprenyl-diphosphatase
VTLLAVALLALAGFALLAAAYPNEPLAGWDEGIAEWVAGNVPDWLEWLARPFSWLGGWPGLTVLGIVVVLALARERAWLDVGFFLAAFVGSQVVFPFLKLLFDRERPDIDPAIPLPESSSFPSGHAVAGAACVGAVAVLAAERLPSRRARRWLWAAAAALGLAIGLSRVALGVHYATDVIAGWCLGVVWLAACLLVRDALRARPRGPDASRLPSSG